jgi:alpha-mannosidase
MRLSLLRAPKHPDPTADIGREHRFTYALQPHAGDFRGGVVRAGYDLNMPLTAVAVPSAAGELPPAAERLACESENVVIETVKKAEDDDGIIVRLYEAHGARGRHSLQTDLPVRRAVETDLMEREEKEFSVSNGRLRFTLTPFQIRTFKLEL